MKFDFFFFLAFAMQLLVVVVSSSDDPEFWLTVASIPIIVFILLLSGYWVRRESVAGMVFVLVRNSKAQNKSNTLTNSQGHLCSRSRLLHLQTGQNIFRQQSSWISASSQGAHHFRYNHNPTHHRYNSECYSVYHEFWKRLEAILVVEAESGR